MRILQVCRADFYLNKFLVPLILALQDDGFEVECVCSGQQVHNSLRKRGITVHEFNFPQRPSPLAFGRSILRFQSFLRNRRFDCVNSHNRDASIVARVAAWRESIPVNLYTAHGFYFHDDQGYLTRNLTIALEAALARITDFTMSQSAEDTRFMCQKGLIAREKILTIGNGIPTQRFRARTDRRQLEERLGLPPNRFRVASTGRLVKGKGFTDLIRAFAIASRDKPDFELLLIGGNVEMGTSPYAESIRQMIHDLGLDDSVRVTGLVDNVEEYLSASDLFALASYREGMPRALLEAMSTGLPVIGTAIRGCREIIIEGYNGFIFSPHDYRRLSELLGKVYEMGDDLKELGARGRQRAVEYFDEVQYVERQVAQIGQLCSETSA